MEFGLISGFDKFCALCLENWWSKYDDGTQISFHEMKMETYYTMGNPLFPPYNVHLLRIGLG